MRDKADGAGSPRTRAHGMLRRPFMQREHQRASEPMLAVWREHDEAAELVSVSVLAVREHAADSADRGQGGDEAEEKVGRGVVRPVKPQTDVRLGKKKSRKFGFGFGFGFGLGRGACAQRITGRCAARAYDREGQCISKRCAA